MDETELADVIGRARQQDAEAFDRIIDAYGQRLYGYLYRLTGSRHDAEELLQELFLRLVRTIGAYEHVGRFEGWLFRIATNLVRDRIRRAGRALDTVRLETSEGGQDRYADARWRPGGDASMPLPEEPLILKEEVDAVQKALAELPEPEREVVMLRYFSSMSFAEIAETMETPLGTALARAHRGLAKLRERMTE